MLFKHAIGLDFCALFKVPCCDLPLLFKVGLCHVATKCSKEELPRGGSVHI